MQVVVIGAGPTGLAAASRLQELGTDWLLLEAEQQPGGLSASFVHEGFTWDLGGHIVFSHYDSYDSMLNAIMPAAEWIEHERKAFVRILDGWLPYPFQNNIGNLPAAEREECQAGLDAAAARGHASAPATFQDWIDRNAGAGIARLFMNPYNFKVWAYRPDTMSASWLGDRVARPNPLALRRQIETGRADDRWGPNRTFRFPARGGTGEIWRRLAGTLNSDRVRYGARVVRVEMEKGRVTLDDGRVISYDALVSTIPLDLLLCMSEMKHLAARASGLVHNSTHVLGFGMRGVIPEHARGMCWLYFPEPADPFYRVTMFSHYSAANAPRGCYSVMAEVSESPAKPVDHGNLAGLALERLRAAGLVGPDDQLVSRWMQRIERAYPVPTLGRDAALSALLPALEERSVYSRGRFGAWKYEVGNMDHAYAQGVEIADFLVSGKQEMTVRDPVRMNEQGGGR